MKPDQHGQHRRNDMKRGKYAVSVDPRLVEIVDDLVGTGFLRSRSHGVEEALRLYVAVHKERINTREQVPA